MSDTLESLSRKIHGAKDLESVVRTMKVLAASSIGQYEKALRSLDDYFQAVEMGLYIYFRQFENGFESAGKKGEKNNGGVTDNAQGLKIDALVIGSDQGLVGQFNDALACFALREMSESGAPENIWAAGERICSCLESMGVKTAGVFEVPGSAAAITPLVSRIILEFEAARPYGAETPLYIFYNRPARGAAYEPCAVKLLPLDESWRLNLMKTPWPTKKIPEVIRPGPDALLALVREYIFVLLFRCCAESLACENACRLAAMQRAEKNIGELLEDLNLSFHRLRQSSIDEELFDVISGFEAHGGNR